MGTEKIPVKSNVPPQRMPSPPPPAKIGECDDAGTPHLRKNGL